MKRKYLGIKLSPLQIAVHLTAWLLLAWLAWDYFSGNLGVNPIQAATQRSGRYAIIYLILSLACTPLNTVFGFRQALTARRALGLYAFMFASTHLLIFSGVDFGFDWSLLKPEILQKPYILIGLATLTILSALALTSFKWWMKRLGKNWKRLHKLVYLASVLVVIHYAWAKKGDLFRLQGDILWPLIAGGVVMTLLFLRLPSVRKTAVQWRNRIQHRQTLRTVVQEQ
jgi:sulfoxide reductase heme-binding subunit YedZ